MLATRFRITRRPSAVSVLAEMFVEGGSVDISWRGKQCGPAKLSSYAHMHSGVSRNIREWNYKMAGNGLRQAKGELSGSQGAQTHLSYFEVLLESHVAQF